MFLDWALKNGGTLYPLTFSPDIVKNRSIFNPSISISQDGIGTLVFRTSNYRYLRPTPNFSSLTSTGSIQYLYGKKQIISNSFFFAQHNFSLVSSNSVVAINIDRISLPEFPEREKHDFRSLEDLRICAQDQKFTLLGNLLLENRRRPIYFETELYSEWKKVIPVRNLCVIDFPGMMNIEKNWVPIEGDPNQVIRWPISSKSETHLRASISVIRRENNEIQDTREQCTLFGGSPFIRYEDGFLTVVHYRESGKRKNTHRYLHKFIYYDRNFEVLQSSLAFTFLDFDTEFCSGISIYKDRIYMSFSCNDSLNFVVSFSKLSNLWSSNFG